LIRRLDHELRGVAWSVVRTSDGTDDVMQETYEKAFRALGRFEGRSSMKTWLHAICYRTAIDHRHDRSRRDFDNVEELEALPDPTSTASAATDRTELAAVLATLDPQQRALLMLTAGLGYSFDETAQIVGMPRGTVASRVSRARQKIARWGST
jgi:RNA polymerase sigma-70 factor (ECF subfamily)